MGKRIAGAVMMTRMARSSLVLLAMLVLVVPLARSFAGPDVVRSRFRVSVDLMVDGASGHGEGVWEVHMDRELTRYDGRAYYETRVFGEAIEVQLTGGRTALVLRRSAIEPTNYGYGAFIVDCLVGTTSLNDRPEALRDFERSCTAHQRTPMVVLVQDDSPAGLLRATYEGSGGGQSVIDSITLTSRVTTDAINIGISERYPWIAELPVAFGADGASKTLWMNQFYREDFTVELQ